MKHQSDVEIKILSGEAALAWGIELEIRQLFEELAELIVKTNHYVRGKASPLDVASEIADVLIMIESIKIIIGITDSDIQNQIDFKIERLKERVVDQQTKIHG